MIRLRHSGRGFAILASALFALGLTLVLPAHAAASHDGGSDACATCRPLTAQAQPAPPPAVARPLATVGALRPSAPRVAPSIPTRTPGPVRGPPSIT